jgi:hypothetical protein
MKFRSEIDEKLAQLEFAESRFSSMEEFLKKRRELEIELTDWERSQAQKHNWRQHRWEYMKGIRKFHNSTQGKRFHRQLGRFLATRDFSDLSYLKRASTTEKVIECVDLFVPLLSALTHALIEKRYYESNLSEEVDYNVFLEELIREVRDALNWLLGEGEKDLNRDFLLAIIDITSPKDEEPSDESQGSETEAS